MFDFNAFSTNVIKIIDEIRSSGADPNKVDDSSPTPTESRINAFYRAIGLPAFSTDETVNELNNGNIFGKTTDEEVRKKVGGAFSRDSKFSKLLDEETQKNFLDSLSDIDIKNSITNRSKGSLFPMVVNGNLRIYPQSKRVGKAFVKKDSDLRVKNIVYRRPLIETIVLLRLRQDGLTDDRLKQELEKNFGDLEEKGFFEGKSENLLSFTILSELIKVIRDPEGISKIVHDTVKDLGKIRDNSREYFQDTSNEKSTIPAEIQTSVKGDTSGQLEQLEETRNAAVRKNEAKLTLLEYDDNFSKETTKNMKEAILAPAVLDLLLNENPAIEKEIEDTKIRVEKINSKQRTLQQNMDVLLGTYSGISGVDVLVVITALFSISIEDLLGLLNSDNISRLKVLLGNNVTISANSDVMSAISSLEEKVRFIYGELKTLVDSNNLINEEKLES